MFELLTKRVIDYSEKTAKENAYFIKHGYFESWSDEYKTDQDRGLKKYLTELRWNQYKNGTITRTQAECYAINRLKKQTEKELNSKLAKIDRVAAANDINYFSVSVEYKKSSTWGYNPHAELYADHDIYYDTASGCGYDKESAAVGGTFNSCDAILKILYTIKENALKEGKSDYSKTACGNVNNTQCCGYGAGYSVLPYFEGGVGVNCFWSILEKAGYKTKCFYGKHENNYQIEKEN